MYATPHFGWAAPSPRAWYFTTTHNLIHFSITWHKSVPCPVMSGNLLLNDVYPTKDQPCFFSMRPQSSLEVSVLIQDRPLSPEYSSWSLGSCSRISANGDFSFKLSERTILALQTPTFSGWQASMISTYSKVEFSPVSLLTSPVNP